MSSVTEERPKTRREPFSPRPRIFLPGISWDTYEQICREIGAKRHVRLVYNGERLEIVSPLPRHERYKYILGRMVDQILLGLRIPYEAGCESRWKSETALRGLESDETFFISFEKVDRISGRPADQPGDPFPDLAIEIDTSDQAADRMSVYAALGIPELWTYDGDRLRIFQLLADATYEEIANSQFLPVSAEEITEWVEAAEGVNLLEWIVSLQAWIRDELVPRRPGQ